MKHIVHIVMFLSAFLPMFIIMWIKEIIAISINVCKSHQLSGRYEWTSFLNWYLIIELIIIIIIITIFSVLLKGIKESKKTNRRRNKKIKSHAQMSTKTIIIKQSRNMVIEYYLNYFTLFVLSLFAFSLVNIIDIIILCFLLFTLGIVYIKNGMYFINPTVTMLKSFIYSVEYEEDDKLYNTVVISSEKIYNGETVNIFHSCYDFTFLERKIQQ